MAPVFLTHQSHNVPGVTAAEGLAVAEGDGDHSKDDEGADVGPQVDMHRLFDHSGEGEHTHHAEGEQQLECQDAEHLHRGRKIILIIFWCRNRIDLFSYSVNHITIPKISPATSRRFPTPGWEMLNIVYQYSQWLFVIGQSLIFE